MVNKLTEAQKWAIKVRSSLSIISDNVHSKNKRMKKVMFNEVKELLSFNPLPCCEPEITKLEVSKSFCWISYLLSCLKATANSFSCFRLRCRPMLRMLVSWSLK